MPRRSRLAPELMKDGPLWDYLMRNLHEADRDLSAFKWDRDTVRSVRVAIACARELRHRDAQQRLEASGNS